MKTILFACLCLFCANNAFAQMQPVAPTAAEIAAKQSAGVERPMPFKGANTIIIHAPDSASAALQKIGRLMVVGGYTMEKFDLSLGYLTTKGKPVGQITPAVYTYNAVVLPEPGGTALRIKGEYAIPVGLRTISESMFWTKGNLLHAKQCFNAIEKIAASYPGARIAYMLQP